MDLRETALQIGLPERHAQALAQISTRRELSSHVHFLMENFKGYSEMMDQSVQMWDDPAQFNARYRRLAAFKRLSTLSLMYSYASPVQVTMILLEDAAQGKQEQKYFGGDLADVFCRGFFEEQRFARYEAAFYSDLSM